MLHRIARRPRTQAGPGFRADDDIVRRRSSVAVIAACGIRVAVPLGGATLVAGSTLLSLPCPGGWTVAAGRVLLALAVVALGALVWFVSTLRQLATDLGLAVGTVARAFRELEQAGLVYSRRGAGTRVALPVQLERPQRRHRLQSMLSPMCTRPGTLAPMIGSWSRRSASLSVVE